jgi:hypothetical protein
MKMLTKSLFRTYLECPNEFWLAVQHPEFMEDRGWRFQAKVESERLFAKFDVFAENAGEIYEVKSSKYRDPSDLKNRSAREVNLYDVGFQVFVARESGLSISKAFLVTLNGDYALGDELDLERLFVIEDVTRDVEAMQVNIGLRIEAAFAHLESEPEIEFSKMCGSKLKCPYFSFKDATFPERTITEIPRLQGKKLTGLLEQGIINLFDVPADYALTETQRDFVDFVQNGESKIDIEKIKERIDELQYPLYYLDYETVNPSIPQIKGMSPLAQITFQYSLHIKQTADSELEHFEFLSNGSGIPPRELAENLSKVIGKTGSVIVWYKLFEISRNTEMGVLYPEFAEFFESVNSRVFDLYEIFKDGLYRDPAIRNNSLKTVLPILVPELNYNELEIGNGGLAMSLWFDEVFFGQNEQIKLKTLKNLRDYCFLDTLAMVRILEVLQKLK